MLPRLTDAREQKSQKHVETPLCEQLLHDGEIAFRVIPQRRTAVKFSAARACERQNRTTSHAVEPMDKSQPAADSRHAKKVTESRKISRWPTFSPHRNKPKGKASPTRD